MARSIFDIPLFNDGIISSDKEDKIKKFRGEDNEIPLSISAYDLASYVYSGNTSTYNITLPRIATILNQAKTGDAREQSQLFKMLQDKDPIISAHLQTRKQAVQSVEWNITGGEGDYKRSEVTKILQDAGIDELIKHLSDAVAVGYSGAGIQWKMGGGDIDGFTFINSDNWIFDEYGNVGLTNYQGSDIVISDKSSPWNDIFIFHKYMLRPGIASEGGLLRNLAQYSFFKSEAVGNFARFLEKYGMPLLSTTIPKSDFENSSIRNRIKNILKNFGSDGAAVMAEGSKIENLAGSTAANAPIFTAFIDEMNKNITLAILGQEATSGVAGGLSKGGAQENVRLDLLSGDCKALSETINRQLVSHLEYNKWASKELKFVMNYEPAEDIKTLAEKINAAKSLGFDPPKDWVEEKFKMPLNDAKETFSLGAMPTATPASESAPAIPAISVQEPTASTPAPVAPVATPEAELTTSAGTELTGLNSLRAFADLNTEYASEYNRIIDSASVSEDIKNELRAIAPSNSDMIYSVISSKLLDESTTDEERTSLANLRSALSSINVEDIQQRLEMDKKREAEIQKAIEESSKIDIQIPKDFLRWKDEEQLAYLNAERKKLESMPDSEQKKNILDELNQLEAQEIGTATQAKQLEVAPVEPAVIETPDSERKGAIAAEIVSDNANSETQEELPESVYIPSVAEEFRKSTMLEEYKSVVVETGDEDKWKEMFQDKYGVTPDTLEVYTFEEAIDYDNKAMAQIQDEQVEQRIPEQQELIANINLKTEGMPYDVKATVYEKASKYGTNIDLAIEQAQQEYTLKSQAGLIATEQPKLDIKQEELNSKLQEAITLSTLGKHNNEEYARKYFDKAIESISDEATKRVAIANKESLWNSFSRARELMVFQRLQAERSTINFDGVFQELNGNPAGTSDSIIGNLMDDIAKVPGKTWEAFYRGYQDFAVDIASFTSIFIPGDELEKETAAFRAYRAAEEGGLPIEANSMIAKGFYGITKMAPQIMATVAIGAATGGVGSVAISYMQGAGSAYGAMMDMGIDPRIAGVTSLIAGIPYAALEKFQLNKAKFTTKGGNLGVDKLIAYIAKTKIGAKMIQLGVTSYSDVLQTQIENTFKNYVKYYGKEGFKFVANTAEEIAAEGAQEMCMDIFEDFAGMINDYAHKTNLSGDVDYQNWFNSFYNSSVESIPTMVAMQIVGGTSNKVLSKYAKYLNKKNLDEWQKKIVAINIDNIKDVNTRQQLMDNIKLSIDNPESVSGYTSPQRLPAGLQNSQDLKDMLSVFRNTKEAVDNNSLNISFTDISNESLSETESYKFFNENKNYKAFIKKDIIDGKERISIAFNTKAIYGNKDIDAVKKDLIGIFGHEDFVHRFLYSSLGEAKQSQLSKMVNSYFNTKEGKALNFPEAEYRSFYGKQGLTNARIEQNVIEEKVAWFFEKGGFINLIDKTDEQIKKTLGVSRAKNLFKRITDWFRINLSNIFGKATDADILNFVSACYIKYRYNAPSAKAAAELLKKEITGKVLSKTIGKKIGVEDMAGLNESIPQFITESATVISQDDSAVSLISGIRSAVDPRIYIIQNIDAINEMSKRPELSRLESFKKLQSDVSNIIKKNPDIEKAIALNNAGRSTSLNDLVAQKTLDSKTALLEGVVISEKQYATKEEIKNGAKSEIDAVIEDKTAKFFLYKLLDSVKTTSTMSVAEYAKRITNILNSSRNVYMKELYKRQSIAYVQNTNISEKAKDSLIKQINRTPLSGKMSLEKYYQKLESATRVAIQKNLIESYRKMYVEESLIQIDNDATRKAKEKINTLASTGINDSVKFIEKAEAIIKNALGMLQSAKDITGTGLPKDVTMSLASYFKEKFKQAFAVEKKTIKEIKANGKEIKSYLRSLTISEDLRKDILSKIFGSEDITNIDDKSESIENIKNVIDKEVQKSQKADAILKLKSELAKLKRWKGGEDAFPEKLAKAWKDRVGKNLENVNLEGKPSPDITQSIQAMIDFVEKPILNLKGFLADSKARGDYPANIIDAIILSLRAIERKEPTDVDMENTILTAVTNIRKNRIGEDKFNKLKARITQKNIEDFSIEDIELLTNNIKNIIRQHDVKLAKLAIEREKNVNDVANQMGSVMQYQEDIEQTKDNLFGSIAGVEDIDNIKSISIKYINEKMYMPQNIKDALARYINDISEENIFLDNIPIEYNSDTVRNAIIKAVEEQYKLLASRRGNARKLFKAIHDVALKPVKKKWGALPNIATMIGQMPPDVIAYELDGYKDTGIFHNEIYNPLRKGQNEETRVIKNFKEKYEATLSLLGIDNDFLEREKHKISLKTRLKSDETSDVELSMNQVIALYFNLKNKDNKAYLTENGFVLPLSDEQTYFLPQNIAFQIDSIINNDAYSDKAIGIINLITELFAQNASEANIISSRLFGFNVMTEDDYYTIIRHKSENDKWIQNDPTTIKIGQFINGGWPIEESSIFQERKGTSKSPIVLHDATSVLQNHTNTTAKYVGYVEPLQKIKSILGTQLEDGSTIIQRIQKIYGVAFANSFQSTITSIEDISAVDLTSKIINATMGLAGKGMLAGRLTTIAVQPLGIMTALQEFESKYWKVMLKINPANLPSRESIDAKSMLAWRRSQFGGFNIIPGLKEAHSEFSQQSKIMEKYSEFGDSLMNIIGAMDSYAVRYIYKMVDIETDYKIKNGEIDANKRDEVFNERFELVLSRSQGSSNLIERSPLQLEKGAFAKVVTFMSAQQTKERAYLYKAIISGSFKDLSKTALIQGVTSVIESLMRVSIKALTKTGKAALLFNLLGVKEDEDEDKFWQVWGKYWARAGSDKLPELMNTSLKLLISWKPIADKIGGYIGGPMNKQDIRTLDLPFMEPVVYLADIYKLTGDWASGKRDKDLMLGYSSDAYYTAMIARSMADFAGLFGTGFGNLLDTSAAVLGLPISFLKMINPDFNKAPYLVSPNPSETSIPDIKAIEEFMREVKAIGDSVEEKPQESIKEKENIGDIKVNIEEAKGLTSEQISKYRAMLGLSDLMSFADEASTATTQAPSTQGEEKKDAPDASGVVQRLGRKIFEMKQSRDAINQKLEELKAQIIQYLTGEPVEIAGLGKIFKVVGGVVQVANKEKLKEVLVQILKLKPEQADMIIAKSTTPKEIAEYLKIQSTKVK